MVFTDKYISTTDKKTDLESKKVVLTDDAYAIAEAVDTLIKKIEHLRVTYLTNG